MITRMFDRAFDRLLPALRFALLAAIIGAFAAGGYYVMSHPGAIKTAAARSASDGIGGPGVRGRIKGFRMAEKTAGEDRWNLNADLVSLKDDVNEMTEVYMCYFPAMKKGLEMELTSRSAVVQNATSDVVFNGGVQVKTNGKTASTLHAETLNWNHHTRRIFTDGPVRVESRNAVITGQGLVVDMERQSFDILHAVRAVF